MGLVAKETKLGKKINKSFVGQLRVMLDEEQQRWHCGIIDMEFNLAHPREILGYFYFFSVLWEGARLSLWRRIGVKSSLFCSWVGKLPGQGAFLG